MTATLIQLHDRLAQAVDAHLDRVLRDPVGDSEDDSGGASAKAIQDTRAEFYRALKAADAVIREARAIVERAWHPSLAGREPGEGVALVNGTPEGGGEPAFCSLEYRRLQRLHELLQALDTPPPAASPPAERPPL